MSYEQEDPRGEKPAVRFDALTQTASFRFRDKNYPLPGKYASHAAAAEVAYKLARSMGWRG